MWPFGPSDQVTSVRSRSNNGAAEEDKALAEFTRSFQSTDESNDATTPVKQVVAPTAAIGGIVPPIKEPKHEALPDGRRVYEDGTVDITPDQLYPQSMDCRQAFDQAFYCQSLGGKFNDIYRYGELKSCSEQWGAFWFCMRTRTLGDGEKARQTTEYYHKRDTKRRAERGNSEDVWEVRTRSVREAFGKDPDGATTGITAPS